MGITQVKLAGFRIRAHGARRSALRIRNCRNRRKPRHTEAKRG